MNPAHTEYLFQLCVRLDAQPKGQRGPVAQEAASFLGCSVGTVYRKLEKVGWDSGRKVRSDCGKLCVPAELALQVAGIIKTATRATGKKTLPITTTVGTLEDNGMGVVNEETGQTAMPSAATISRAMTRFGCHPDQIARGHASISMRTLHPNHVWEMDASVCILYFLANGHTLIVEVIDESESYKNKPKNLAKIEPQRIIRWVITDHYTGTIFVRYTLGAEDQFNALNVLMEAMCDRTEANGQDIFRGAPLEMYTDKGAPFVGSMTKSFLQHAKIRHYTHKAKNARATGQVENAQNIVETQFEGRLRFLEVDSLDALNAQLDKWRIAWNANAIHRRYEKTRNQLWMTITPEQLRVPESIEALRAIVQSNLEEKKVHGNLILAYAIKGYGRHEYSLRNIPGIVIGQKIGVCVNPYEAPAVDITVTAPNGEETIYTLQPIKKNEAGFDVTAPVMGQEFAAAPDTIVDRAIKGMDMAAYGVETLEEAEKAKKQKRRAYADINIMADVEAKKDRTYFPVRSTDLDVSAPARELAPLTVVQAAFKLQGLMREAGVEWNASHMARITEHYPKGVPHEDIDTLADGFIAETRPVVEQPEPVRMRGVA